MSRDKYYSNRKKRSGWLLSAALLLAMIWAALPVSRLPFIPETSQNVMQVEAATVSCKSNYYITTKISKKTLKKGKKAKVTVTVKNTTGATMKSLKISTTLPSYLKKSSGSLSKTKASLANNKSFSYSFKVKAKKKVTFKKTVTTSKSMIGLTTKVVAKNPVKKGSKQKYMTVTMTCTRPAAALVNPDSYADAMIDLLADMSVYAKKINPSFAMVTNGGYGLYMTEFNKNAVSRSKLYKAMDGILIEEVFTGGTASITSTNMQKAIRQAKAGGLAAFNLEYKGTASVIADKSSKAGSVWFNASSYDLNTIPALDANRMNTASVTKITQVKNYLALLDQEKYDSKKEYMAALKNNNYDMIFIDAYDPYNDKFLSKADVDSLKVKKNGGKRLVCAYVSVGEAENYRYYWDKDWNKKLPVWIDSENKDWEGNFKVKYWSKDWQQILYGSSDSYMGHVLAAGFDGAYLDVIDAYEYFNKKK